MCHNLGVQGGKVHWEVWGIEVAFEFGFVFVKQMWELELEKCVGFVFSMNLGRSLRLKEKEEEFSPVPEEERTKLPRTKLPGWQRT